LLSSEALAVPAAAVYGKGRMEFQNYNFGATSLNAPVSFGTTANVGGVNGVAGVRVGSEFSADLLYSLDGGTSYNLLTAAQSESINYPTSFAFGFGVDGDAANFAGYFFGTPITIPGYTSGPISFIVEAFTGTSYANASWRGQSESFTMSSSPVGTVKPGDFFGLTAFTVNPVPEPTVFALAGLGAAALMIIRRRK
jgi:hypothetical protein